MNQWNVPQDVWLPMLRLRLITRILLSVIFYNRFVCELQGYNFLPTGAENLIIHWNETLLLLPMREP